MHPKQKSSIISKTDVMPSDVEAITNGISNLHIAENSSQSRRGRQINGPNSTATIDHAAANRTTADQASKLLKHEKFTVDKSTYADAKIKAVFYPKFDNDKSHQDRVRIKMIDKVSKGEAILEVSLKHSGSLFMYAGHESGAYSKNDFGNIYTAVGVFVLGRTFRQAWGSEASKKQAEFNEFLERQHMNISMELVTAVLDDHGQRPREDYVVVTAVTEVGNGKPKFYSTPEIIAFCRKWRLPTNHVWLFSTRKSVTTFFATYDQLREEGTATSVCRVLDEVADISVPGSVDHVKFQGEILEGLVARIVSHESTKEIDLVLKDYPSPIAEVHQDLGPGLREIFAANRSDEKQQIKALLQNTGTSFCPNGMDWIGIEAADLLAKNGDPLVSKFLQAENGHHLVSKFLQANPSDYSTTKLKEIVSLIREKLSKDVDFKPSGKKVVDFKHKINSISSENLNFKMVIHVRDDSAFLKYQKEMRDKRDLWPLYRGFFVDINLFKASKERVAEIAKICNDIGNSHKGSDETSTESGLEDEDANLMIKLKFLKYKLRTFLIRNGLSHLIKDDGRAAYKDYYERQMDTWKISKEKKTRLTEMLEEWAEYITRNTNRIQLPSSNYLSEAEPFLEQYAKRSPENQALIGYAGDLVRTEDFLASVQGGRDKEGDIESEKVLEPCSPSHEAVQKKEGLIVFFPGIPGCAKSVLCDAIKNALEGLEDDRPICSLMGDKIEGTYWKKVADKLREKPCSILLADKNAPNVDVWEQIGKMSRETKASAVPIVPVSEGTESNPFSLDALAVFMHRVLNRVNHPGNLEKSTPNVGFVLLMFYDLYDGKNRAEFESNLIELFGSLVKMPLLKSERTPLPDSVKTVLEEGIRLYRLHTTRHGGLDKGERDAWETQLKDVLSGNAEYLTSIQVPFDVVVDTVLEQLKIIMKFGTIVYAAIDVPLVDVHNLLSNISENELKVKLFLENKDLENSLKKAHITLAHKRSHGVTALAHYGPFLNQKVPVDVTALIISDQLAAFETHPGSIDGHKINSKNKWAHLTLWTAEGIPPREANTLPDLVSLGKATRVEINPPFRVSGVLQFH